MSPIKDASVYPDDWPEIRKRILERAGDRCECSGECGVDHHNLDSEGRCIERHGRVAATFGGKNNHRPAKVVLTLAHLDHDAAAGDHSDGNLKALCQRCHLRYDGEHRRAQRTGQERLFGKESVTEVGVS